MPDDPEIVKRIAANHRDLHVAQQMLSAEISMYMARMMGGDEAAAEEHRARAHAHLDSVLDAAALSVRNASKLGG